MALLPDRQIDSEDFSFFCNTVTNRGVILTVTTAGSGVSLDNPSSVVGISANSSGALPVGMLINDVVNIDLTRTPINWHKDQVQVGSKVTLVTKGWLVTDQATGTIGAGTDAVLGSSGTIFQKPAIASWNRALNPQIGKFRSNPDQNGFVKVYVDL